MRGISHWLSGGRCCTLFGCNGSAVSCGSLLVHPHKGRLDQLSPFASAWEHTHLPTWLPTQSPPFLTLLSLMVPRQPALHTDLLQASRYRSQGVPLQLASAYRRLVQRVLSRACISRQAGRRIWCTSCHHSVPDAG